MSRNVRDFQCPEMSEISEVSIGLLSPYHRRFPMSRNVRDFQCPEMSEISEVSIGLLSPYHRHNGIT